MAYTIYIYRFPNSNEFEIKWAGNYGAKGEKRGPKEKAAPEQIEKQNQWMKEKKAIRTVKLNFFKGDLWCTLLYPKGTRKSIEEIKDDKSKFLTKLRKEYKKRGSQLKWMLRIEIGSRGGIHMHFLCNQIRGEPIDMVIQKAWGHGRVHFERFAGEEEDYQRLASYLVKAENEEQQERLNKMKPGDRKALVSYSTSRNLKRPVPEKKEYKRRTLKPLIEDGIKPTPGYYIDKQSIHSGINQFTGMSYLYYTEVKVDPGGGSG